ncbi:glycerate kinase [Streptomyces sp. NPDC059928]|uniref:glycerate kinase n=1 Tax=unclassified Streptomyces TaxID=2593676 RepID=UPI003660D112
MTGTHPLSPTVVVAPNCFRGYATAAEVATALADGVRDTLPEAQVALMPLADGGDGTLDALAAARGGERRFLDAPDAQGQLRRTPWLALDARSAVIETAQVCGLGALRPHEVNPLEASSAGVGRAVGAAVAAGATTVLLGLGGTAVVDGGVGALAALGARFLGADGRAVPPRPGNLQSVVRVDLEPARRLLVGVSLRLLSDVRTPLAGNLQTFGAQKGVTDQNRPAAVRALEHLVRLLEAAGDRTARARFEEPWFGAGGGTGFGLSAVATSSAENGAEGLLGIVDPDDAIGSAALAITAEGAVDESTWQGKLPGAVAQRRQRRGLPTAMVAVRFAPAVPRQLVSTHRVVGAALSTAPTGPDLWDGLARAAADACRTWPLVEFVEQI